MLRDRIQDESRRRELTGFIVEEVERLNKVVTNFLQFARPAEPTLEPVDINDALENTISFLEPEIAATSVTISRELAPGLAPVLADPDQCRQIFLNLFMNAFQAMNGTGSISIATRPAAKDPIEAAGEARPNNFSPTDIDEAELQPGSQDMIEVVIADTGRGISQEELARIFDPFFSTKDEGVGLGLSLVHKIIENHNGRIRVSSKPGNGTTFVISLPEAGANEAKG
jgi:two-component system sensor histidine kinase HydH